MSIIYLHIGTPKTGTTAIQHLLTENRDILEKHGIAFPDLGYRYRKIGDMRNGHFLIAPLRSPNAPADHTRPCADYETGLDQLAELGARYDRIILSDEGIWNAAQRRENFWEQLKLDLKKRGLSLKILLYLRRQDLFVQSMYIQKILQTNASETFSDYLDAVQDRTYPICLDYDRYACFLAELFGWDSLIIRVFEKEQFRGPEKNLFSDFLDIFGLRMEDGFRTEKNRYNERISKAQLEMKRILNHLSKKRLIDDPLLRSMRAVPDLSEKSDPGSGVSYFEPGTQGLFLDSFAESNAHLARTCFQRDALFFEPLAELPPVSVSDREILEQTVLLYAQAFDTLVQQNQDQAEQIRRLQDDIRALREDVVWYRLKRKAAHILKKDD